MIEWWLLPIPYVTGLINRLWRGEGSVPRWQWYIFNCGLAGVVCRDDMVMVAWLLLLLGYAVLPSQAMFSAVTGRPPTRTDASYIQWLQIVANRITYQLQHRHSDEPCYWYTFGIVYGTLRALFLIPGIAMLWGYTGSPVALSGLALLCMGWCYYGARVLAYHLDMEEDKAIPLAEIAMGSLFGCYMLIISGVL